LQDSAEPIVIVDDAHQLLQKELEILIHEARVPGSSNKIKRLVLFGESNLYTAVTKLAASLSTQPAVNKIYLPGLTKNQTAEYLQHRLAIGGYSGKLPFNPSAINRIHQTSGGYPGPINEIAHQWLSDKYSNKKERHNMLQKLSATPRRMVTWIAAAVIIILLGALWLFSDRQPSTSKAPDQQLAKTVFRKKIVPDRKLSERTVTKKIAAKPPAVIETQQSPEADTPAKPPAPIKTEPPEKEKTVSPEPTISTPLKIDSQPKTSLRQEAKPVPETPMPETPVPVIAKTATREIRREKWLLSQDAASYTIQIIGVSYEKSMLNFINKNQLLKQNEIAYYESTFNDKPWYQLLYGIYPTKQDARLAAEKLPEDIRQKTEPWIRRLSGVQQTIEK
jgi:DamX protein